VTDDLERLITAMARHQAHHHQCSLAAARCQIRDGGPCECAVDALRTAVQHVRRRTIEQ